MSRLSACGCIVTAGLDVSGPAGFGTVLRVSYGRAWVAWWAGGCSAEPCCTLTVASV